MAEEEGGRMYHERQRLQFCLLHALNNLLQNEKAFTRKELDSIADNLPAMESVEKSFNKVFSLIFKPHRNTLTGNYDANVLIAALVSRGKEVVWFDRRKGLEGLELANYGDRLLGIIVNFWSRKLMGLWQSRHWVTLLNLRGTWYNLDSDAAGPWAFSNGENELKLYLGRVFADGGEVILVMNAPAPSTEIPVEAKS